MMDDAIRKQVIEGLRQQQGAIERLIEERRNHAKLPDHKARVAQLDEEIRQYEHDRLILLRQRTDDEIIRLHEAAHVVDRVEVARIISNEMARRGLDQ